MDKCYDKYNSSTKYEGFPGITVFHEQVQLELERRSKTEYRIKSLIPWVRVTSGLKNITDKDKHSDFKVLSPLFSDASKHHTDFNFKDLYKTDNAFKPLPGIESVNVTHKSTYGGTMIAQIKWKVFTLNQFEELSPYFLNPGISIFIEWGDDSDITEHYLDPKNDYQNISGKNFYNAWQYLKCQSFKRDCKYDAMIGIIKNFEYSLNEEGGYDCITHVVSAGALMYSLDLINQHTNKGPNEEYEKNKTIRRLSEYVVDGELEDDIKTWNNNSGFRDDVQVYIDKNKDPNKSSYFVTWGFIEDYIVNRNLGIKMTSGEGDESSINMFNLRSLTTDDESILISNHPFLRSTNLSVCILPQTSEGTTLNGLTFYPDGDSQQTSGKIRNIFVNLDLVKKAFNDATVLRNALIYILETINAACLFYWDFSLSIKEVNNTMVVIDKKYVDQSLKDTVQDKNLKIYEFKTFLGNGILTMLNFDTKMSEAMATVAMYTHHKLPGDNNVVNSNNDAYAFLFGNINNKYEDQFIEKLIIKNSESLQKESTVKTKKIVPLLREHSNNAGFSEKAKKFLPLLSWRNRKDVGEENTTSIDESEAMKRLVYNIKTRNVNSSHAITPADFSLGLLGISGIRIGDIFTVDCIPARYKQHSLFQVSGLEHSIDSSGWITTINAILRVIDPKAL